jgi:hypothetical protein
MSKENIQIRDFELFYEIVKSLTKIADGVKFMFDQNGLVVYAKNDYSKCNLTSNAAYSQNQVEFCIGELPMLLKILTTVKEMYKDDYESVKMSYEQPFLKVESGKFRTKVAACDEQRISKFVATKLKTELSPMLEFTTGSNLIKAINSHSFIFQNSADARSYITAEPEMQNNTIFATIGNEGNELANSITLELGLINSGTLKKDDGTDIKIILDFNRLNILNMVPSDEIKVMVAKERPVLVSNITKNGKNDTFFSISICSFMMVR